MLQVGEGIRYLHSRNIAHRDLKIENLMFAQKNGHTIKIGDFGLAKITRNPTVTPCGTKEYMVIILIMKEEREKRKEKKKKKRK